MYFGTPSVGGSGECSKGRLVGLRHVNTAVPQGLVLEQILFNVFIFYIGTKSMAWLIEFSYDTQLEAYRKNWMTLGTKVMAIE